jgi:hypothetical protein
MGGNNISSGLLEPPLVLTSMLNSSHSVLTFYIHSATFLYIISHVLYPCCGLYRQVLDAHALFLDLDFIQKWTYSNEDTIIQMWIEEYLIHTHMREFTRQVWRYIQRDLRHRHRDRCMAGDVPLCRRNVNAALKPEYSPPHYVRGNRMSIKDIYSTVDNLWGFDDGQQRKNW